MNYLAGGTHVGYKPETAALFLLIQWISEGNRKQGGPDIFPMITKDRWLMLLLVDRSEEGLKARDETLANDKKLRKIFELAMYITGNTARVNDLYHIDINQIDEISVKNRNGAIRFANRAFLWVFCDPGKEIATDRRYMEDRKLTSSRY